MAKTLLERQQIFRWKREAAGGKRLDMWLPGEEADMLTQLIPWIGCESGPQAVVGLIHIVWFAKVKRAALDGHADAQFEYAKELVKSKKTRTKAVRWFLKSAEQGYRVSAVYNNIGMIIGYTRSHDECITWIRRGAALGSPYALYNLGVLYANGLGVPQNDRHAAGCFLKSAEGGLKAAQQHLGVLYALGKGVPQDFENALDWLRTGRGEDDRACHNFLAQVLSTFPDDRDGLRNGDLAITIAEKLVQSRKSPEYLETLAAAYAEAGRFEDAVKIQEEVLAKLKQQKLLSQKRTITLGHCQKRLQSYLHKKPWRNDLLALWLRFEE